MKRQMRRILWITGLGLLVACAGCSDETGGKKGGEGNKFDIGHHEDASTSDSDNNVSEDVKVDRDTRKDSDTGGADGSSETDVDEPPPQKTCMNQYHRVCDDTCVNVKVDPDNCGACGTQCGAEEACAGGVCAQRCGESEQICERTCVDVKSDSDHCGSCGTACGEGEGCHAGQCVPSLDLTERSGCEDGGPAIDIEWGDGEDRCSGDVAEAAFRWAVCSCSSVTATSRVVTDAFDSTLGPYIPGVLGGGMGVNGTMVSTSVMDIGGSLWASGTADRTLNVTARGKVAVDLKVGGGAHFSNKFEVGGDAWVGSYGASMSQPFAVKGKLTVPEGGSMRGMATYDELVRAPVDVADPCSCAEEQLVPIAALVEDRRTRNDNALIGLDESALSRGNRVSRVDLPCGNYYLDGISTTRGMTIVAHGRTALYIKGDVVGANPLTIKAMPNAELDVFVEGSFRLTGKLIYGSQHYPAATRLYVAGADGFTLTADAEVGGFVYTYPGRFIATSDVEIFGGVFGKELIVTSPLTVHYDRQILRAGGSCPVDDPGPGTDPPDPVDQCLKLDGACESSGDCCAPLICDQGTCGLNRCLATGDSCVYDSDCCGQVCAIVSGKSNGVCIAN